MKAGDKVVCIAKAGDISDSPSVFSALPEGGKVYVVRSVAWSKSNVTKRTEMGIRLVGIQGDIHPSLGIEYAFMARYFRPVAEVGHPPIEVERLEPLEVAP